MKNLLRLCLILILFLSFDANGQVADTAILFRQLHKMDSILFEKGFNECDIKSVEEIVHEDLEFLHDVGGMQNRKQFFEAVKNNICGNMEMKPIRKLVANSLQVFPLYNQGKLYAAIQIGNHDFFISEKDKKLRKTGTAKFIHTWFLVNGNWLLKNVLSFDHRSKE